MWDRLLKCTRDGIRDGMLTLTMGYNVCRWRMSKSAQIDNVIIAVEPIAIVTSELEIAIHC